MAIVHAYHVWHEVILSYALLTLLIDSGEKGMTACVLVCFDCVDKLWGNMFVVRSRSFGILLDINNLSIAIGQ